MTLEWGGSEETLRLCKKKLPIFSFRVGFWLSFAWNMLVSVTLESHLNHILKPSDEKETQKAWPAFVNLSVPHHCASMLERKTSPLRKTGHCHCQPHPHPHLFVY